MEPLTIAFYTDSFLPARDGVVTSILTSRKELMKKGHDVYIFAAGNGHSKQAIGDRKNIYIIRGPKFFKYPQYSLGLMPFMTFPKIKDLSPDVIHVHTPFLMGAWGLGIGKMRKIPVVSTFHTLFTDKTVLQEYFSARGTKALEKFSWRYARFYYNKCNAVIAPSETVKAILLKKGIRNVYVVPNGIDTDRFNPKVRGGSLRKQLKDNREQKIVLYFGRMSKEKRIETLLKAAKLLKKENIKFVFAGTGPSLKYYTGMAARLKLNNVRFAGFVDDKMVTKYYAAADLLCIPSTFETQGIVCLEAMATGKPVVGADSMALREIIRNGKNGEKFRPNDPNSCAAKIKKVIEHIDNYKETTSTAEQYSLENTTNLLLSVYQKVINDITV